MREEQTILETLNRISIQKKELAEIIALKNEAFKVFEDCNTCTPSLPKMLEIRDKYWKKLYNWNFLNTYSGYIDLQSWEKINSAFDLLFCGRISRTDFAFNLSKSRLSIERYIQNLEDKLTAEKTYFYVRYYEFEKANKNASNWLLEFLLS